MNIALTEEYMNALGVLQGTDIKRAMQTVMSLKKDSTAAGLRAHKITHPCSHIYSYSVNMDLRILAYVDDQVMTLLYIGHHDDSYNWVNKRNFIKGPNQDFRIVSTSKETIPELTKFINENKTSRKISSSLGADLLSQMLSCKNDEEIFNIINNQPESEQEVLFDIALNILKQKQCDVTQPFSTKVITDDQVLQDALLYPLERWRVFLHPYQEDIINASIDENAFITGAPGTGKTVCIVHKAKRFGELVKKDECVIISTFKDCLQNYLLSMLQSINYNSQNIFIVDISAINQLGENYEKNYKYDGVFCVKSHHLFFIKNNRHYRVRHMLIDEYQDYRNGIVAVIKNISKATNITVSYDYSQCIYKQIDRTVSELQEDNKINKLLYSYRINEKILMRLKKIMKLVSILSDSEFMKGGVTEEEDEIIKHTESAITGFDINLISYKNAEEKKAIIENEYLKFISQYKMNEVIITEFFDEINLHLNEAANYKIDEIPDIAKKSYAYLPSLKGQEFKAGIIILDNGICQALNVNRLVFNVYSYNLRGFRMNTRILYNLLYVALSRFRDYITVIYPNEYKETIIPILG